MNLQDYSTEQLSRTQLEMLSDLRDYGLVYQRAVSEKPRNGYWSNTLIAILLLRPLRSDSIRRV